MIGRFAILLALSLCGLLQPTLAAGTGLTGEYFDTSEFTTLKFSRVDPTVNFDWGTGSPAASVAADTFSIRWSGQIEPLYSETYQIFMTADDGARVWINDRLLAARTVSSPTGEEISGRVSLQAGQRYNITLEFIEVSGSAQVKLEWASESQAREIVPSTQLYPAQAVPERGSILVEHWFSLPGSDLTALTLAPNYPSRPDSRDFVTSLECLLPDWSDNYGTRASGWLMPRQSGNYTFAVSGADSVQLLLSTNANAAGRQLIASNQVPTGFRQFNLAAGQISAPLALQAHGKYYLEVMSKQGVGSDHFSVAWQPPGSNTWTIIPGDVLVPSGVERTPPSQAAYLDTLVPSHPRLLASVQRFEWLKRTLASNSIPQLNTWFGSISNSASSMLSQPVSIYDQDVRGTILGTSRTVLDRISKLSLTYWVTGNTNFAERAWAELNQVASGNFPDWHPAHFLDTAEMTHACAIGYDWLYQYWSPARRDTIRNAIITKGLNPSLNLYTNNSSWVASSANNWNLVCNGGMILGALAVGTESEALAEYVLSKAVASAGLVMRHYTADNGGWYEGPGYWDYTTDYNMRLMAALESALGSDFGLSDVRSVWETGLNPMYMVGPLKQSFNYADAGAGNMRGPQLFWLARRYHRPEFSWHERNNAGVEPLDLLWYDGRGLDPQASGLPPDNYFRGPSGTTPYYSADAVTLRSRWLDSDATFIGFKAGEIGASHGNLDAGVFVLDALGVRWAHDLGGDDYALPGYFSEPQRWTYYRMRAEGHNTLVINPGAAADQTVDSRPPIILYTSEPVSERSAVVADLTPAYNISKVWRGIQLLNNRRWTLVQDELLASSPATVWWFMHVHTNSNPVISPDGTTAMLTQGNARLWLSVLSGGGTFALSNAVPLPSSPNPAGQNANSNFRKLAINLTAVTNTTLAVLMVPLRPGENPPTNVPPVIPLVQWAAAGTNVVFTPTNSVPVATNTARFVPTGGSLDVDLRSVVMDAETPGERLFFRVMSPVNGTVTLLPDGYTARFVSLAGFSGTASFAVAATDTWPDPRLAAQYDFEPPKSSPEGFADDRSSRNLPGALTTVGSGTNYPVADTPAPPGRLSSQSLLLRESGDFNGSALNAPVYSADLNFNFQSWSVSAWFKRATTTNDDFVFYVGNSDGFGSPDEFQLYCPSGQSTLVLRHYTGTSTTDLDISVPNIRVGEWHHAAVTFNPTNGNSGTVSFYVDGVLAGADGAVTLNMPSGSSAVFGGHASSSFAVTRWFNGRLDDLALFHSALSASEITGLASRPALYLGGASVTNRVTVNVVPPNQPPVLTVSNYTIVAGAALGATAVATDPDRPSQNLVFELLSAPTGSSIHPISGLIQWKAPPSAVGSSNYFQLRVTEAGWSTNLEPIADAFVRDGSSAGLNFGSDTNLTVKLGTLGLAREAFVRFSLPSMPGALSSAAFELRVLNANAPGAHQLSFCTNDAWAEDAVTWNSKPVANETVATWVPAAASVQQIPLAALVTQEQAADGLLSLRISATNITADGRVDYRSRESGPGLAPTLRIVSTNWSTTSATQSFWVRVVAPRQPLLSEPALSNAEFRFTVMADAGPDYALETSTNLIQWSRLMVTNSPPSPFIFKVPSTMEQPAAFYRVLANP